MTSGKGPGSVVKAKIDKMGIPISRAAKDVGINVQTFNKILKGKSFSVEYAVKLEKYFGDVKAKDLIDMEAKCKMEALKASGKFQTALKAIPKAKAPEKAPPKAKVAKKPAAKKTVKKAPAKKAAPKM